MYQVHFQYHLLETLTVKETIEMLLALNIVVFRVEFDNFESSR
jgi:hypothetical protein